MSNFHREVYTIIAGNGDGKKDCWSKIGASFLNKDGSESVLLETLPVNGKLVDTLGDQC
jgi:hypothetical protein